jgi:poly(3-hydroxybutyrate) depolymerase
MTRSLVPGWRFLCLALLLWAGTGCPQYRDPNVPNAIQEIQEPASGVDYLVYIPDVYDPTHAHPLIVLCHGTKPFDTPRRQMGDWVKLSEEKGFVVIAPHLVGTAARVFHSVETQIQRQRQDEQTILDVVRHARGAYNISDDRIFLVSWSAGSQAALFTGLRNPDVFRAVAVLQGNFDPVLFADAVTRVDPHQPVLVLYGAEDILTGREGRQCVEWLEEHRVNVIRAEMGGGHQGHPIEACTFFEDVVRKVVWMHIRAIQTGRDWRTVQFKIRSSFTPTAYRWSFGDGETSPVAEPRHTYAEPGTYRVTLDARSPRGSTVGRTVEVTVGENGTANTE